MKETSRLAQKAKSKGKVASGQWLVAREDSNRPSLATSHWPLATNTTAQHTSPSACGRNTPKEAHNPACTATTPSSASHGEPLTRRNAAKYRAVFSTSTSP